MGEPRKYLPKCSIEAVAEELSSIDFPPTEAISRIVGGAYHQIFLLKFCSENYIEILNRTGFVSQTSPGGIDTSLILRISGSHVPAIKTANEVGILIHLAKHTSMPVPRVVHYNDTTSNGLQSEYMIISRLSGRTGSEVYPSLSPIQMSYILDQLEAVCHDLYTLDFNHVGGLQPDIGTRKTKYPQDLINLDCFNKRPRESSPETLSTLNVISSDGYSSFTGWLAAQMSVYIHAIQVSPSLSWVLDSDADLQLLTSFTQKLTVDANLQSKLDSVPLKLAHRDLHFGNILLSPISSSSDSDNLYTITGILDWEFSAILPFPLWRHSFLWDGISSPPADYVGTPAEFTAESRRTRERLYSQWAQKVADRGEIGRQMLKDAKWQNNLQEAAWDLVNCLRCVVEVCPRGTQLEDARGWWKEVCRALEVFGTEVWNVCQQ